MYKIILSDGTEIKDLALNGNNFISKTEIKESDFEGKLSHVTIESEQGVETINDAELVQIAKYGMEWWFILREMSEETKRRIELSEIEDALMELAAIITEG